MEKIYNKLVRDNIPSIIEDDNEIAITRILGDEEYRKELYKKLNEECLEVINSKTRSEVIEELSDVLEILMAITKLENASFDEVVEVSNKKRLTRGGFEKRIFLEKTITK